MRRLTIWLLVLALILLALCVLWFLPRLVREEPLPPESGLAAGEVRPGTVEAGPDAQVPPSAETVAGPESRVAAAGEDRDPGRAGEAVQLPGSVHGRLVDRAGRGVEGASVLAAHAPDAGAPVEPSRWWLAYLPLDVARPEALGAAVPQRAASDGEGRFFLADLEAGRVRFAARSARHAPLDQDDLRLAAGQDLDLGDVALDPACELHGRIEDLESLAVVGASLVAVEEFADAGLPALDPSLGIVLDVTDGGGRFGTVPVRPGPWSFRVLGGTNLTDLVVRGSTTQEGWNLVGSLAPAVAISGRIATRGRIADGLVVRALPVESPRSTVPFTCRADGRAAPVQRNGDFEILGLEEGVAYELRAGLLGERFEDESPWSPPVLAVAPEERVRVPWEPGADIHFELVDGGDRSAVASCEIALDGALPERTVLGLPPPDQRGLRTLGGVRPRRAVDVPGLTISSRGFQPVAQRIDLRPGSGTSLGTLTLNRLPELEVRVLDARTGAPLAGALVTATEIASGLDASGLPPLAVATDAAGEARVASYGGAGSRLEVRSRGRANARRVGPFGGGFKRQRIEVQLFQGATARIQVLDSDGRGVPAARVEWIEGSWSPNEDAPDPDSRIADAEGRVTFAHLAPGRHAFRVQRHAAWLDGEWTQREFADGDEIDVELQSPARAAVDLRVTDGGIPLAGVPAVLLPASAVASRLDVAKPESPLPPGLSAHLDARGAQRFQEVDPGPYVLAVGVPGQRFRACTGVTVRPGSNVVTVDLARTSVSGKIADAAGQPVAGAEILVVDLSRERDLRGLGRRRGSSGSIASGPDLVAAEALACTADEKGEFRVLGIPSGEGFRILALAGDHLLGKSEVLEIQADAATEALAVVLLPAGALEIRVSASPGALAATVLASPHDRRATPRLRRIFPGLPALLRGLEPGLWEIELGYDGSGVHDRRRVEVAAGETGLVELSLP